MLLKYKVEDTILSSLTWTNMSFALDLGLESIWAQPANVLNCNRDENKYTLLRLHSCYVIILDFMN